MKKRFRFWHSAASSALLLFLFLTGCAGATASVSQSDTPDAVLTVEALNVGKADAFVLTSESHTVVIDTATEEEGDRVVDSLNAKGVETVDALIITHFDKDHVGGADLVLDNFTVEKVYTTYQSKDSDDIDEFYVAMNRSELTNEVVWDFTSFTYDGVTYAIYPPGEASYDKDESNNSSLVIRVDTGEGSMLFTGDAEKKRIKELLKIDGLASDILKMPHHGRIEDNTDKLIDAISPTIAVITSSEKEPEDEEVLELLSDAAVETYLTRDGDLTISFTGEGILINQY